MRVEWHGSHECLLLLLLLSAAAAGVGPPFAARRRCRALGAQDVDACGGDDDDVRLPFCHQHALTALLPATRCDAAALRRLRRRDEQARDAADRFGRLLRRYDCQNANSVSWTCDDCQKAYKQWVCAMFLPPVQRDGEGVKPCRYICRLVEQRCPYFHPSVKDQYAGERVFKCIDPDIPDLEAGKSWYGPPHRCYCPEGAELEEAECRPLSPAQRRNASSRSGAARPTPLLLHWWTTAS